MFYCFDCGEIYDSMPTRIQAHPYGETFAYETVADDMCGCGGDIVEVEQCEKCGGYFEPYEMYNGLCIRCDIESDEEEMTEWED